MQAMFKHAVEAGPDPSQVEMDEDPEALGIKRVHNSRALGNGAPSRWTLAPLRHLRPVSRNNPTSTARGTGPPGKSIRSYATR
jgi:hypothetical protein